MNAYAAANLAVVPAADGVSLTAAPPSPAVLSQVSRPMDKANNPPSLRIACRGANSLDVALIVLGSIGAAAAGAVWRSAYGDSCNQDS